MDRDDARSGSVVCIVDDDEAVRIALSRLIRSIGLRVETYASADEFLSEDHGDDVGCLVLDIQLPGMSGFDLHERIVASGTTWPVIFITGHPDCDARFGSPDTGGVAFLQKPFDDDDLLDALHAALSSGPGRASPIRRR